MESLADSTKERRVSTRDVLLSVVMSDSRYVQAKATDTKSKVSLTNLAVLLTTGSALTALYERLSSVKLHGLDELLVEVDEAAVLSADAESEGSALDSVKKKFLDLLGFKEERSKDPVVAPVTVKTGAPSLDAPKSTYSGKLATPSTDVKAALQRQARLHGVDYSALYALAGAESSFRVAAAAKTSSATGLLQFTSGTWSYLVSKYALPYTLEDRNNPDKAAGVAAMYLKEIRAAVSKVVPSPSIGDLYAGYFLGPTGGSRFLSALKKNPNAIGVDLFPAAAKANKNLFFSGSKPLTLRETYSKLSGKISAYYVASTTPSSSTSGSSLPSSDEAPDSVKVSRSSVSSTTSTKTPEVNDKAAKATPINITLTDTSSRPSSESVEHQTSATSTGTRQLSPSPRTAKPDTTYARTRSGVVVSLPS